MFLKDLAKNLNLSEDILQTTLKSLKLRAKGDKLRAEGNKLRDEGDKLRDEGDKLWAEAVLEFCGNITMQWVQRDGKDGCACLLENGETFEPNPA